MAISDQIIARIKEDGGKYWASDNVAKYMRDGDDQELIEELVPKFDRS